MEGATVDLPYTHLQRRPKSFRQRVHNGQVHLEAALREDGTVMTGSSCHRRHKLNLKVSSHRSLTVDGEEVLFVAVGHRIGSVTQPWTLDVDYQLVQR